MEFYGYHVFNDNYFELTPVQSVFLDIGLTDHWSRIFGSDEDVKKFKHGKHHVKQF